MRGRSLLAGNAMHADTSLTGTVSGTMGWLLAMLAQDVGFPFAEGGSGRLAEAMASRARQAGAELICGERVAAWSRSRTAEPLRHRDRRSGRGPARGAHRCVGPDAV